MALVEEPRSTYVPELGQDINFVYNAFFCGRMSGLFTPKNLCDQHGDVDKVVFPCGYTFTSERDTLDSSYGVADANMTMDTAGVRTRLQ